MKDRLFENIAKNCIERLSSLDFRSIGINEYNLQYIDQVLPNINYHFCIYRFCVAQLARRKIKGFVIDFGGGHGFLSIYLKMLGFNVIYCDNNPLAVATMNKLGAALNICPDVVIEGSVKELSAYCKQHDVRPDYLISVDVIEHIYDLEAFFCELHGIHPDIKMCFATSANPCNFYRRKRLFDMMDGVEKNFFLPMREEFIRKENPDMNNEEIFLLAKLTRGKIYEDVTKAVALYKQKGVLPYGTKSHNSCDPNSGNWMERVLPLSQYRNIINRAGFSACFKSGFYNDDQKGLYGILFKVLNVCIRLSGKFGMMAAPFILVKVKSKRVYNPFAFASSQI